MSFQSFLGIASLLLFSINISAAAFTQVETVAPIAEDESWQTLESQHFRIHFTTSQYSQASRAGVIAEGVHQRLVNFFNWKPSSPTHIVLVDDFDLSNGWATPFPRSQMRLYLSPPDQLHGLERYEDWLELLITHEYVHILHLDKGRDAPEFLRKIFGRFLPLFPNLFQPGFMIEGLATWLEGDDRRMLGRAHSSFYRMQMRMEVKNGIQDLQEAALPLRRWPLNQAYLYGLYFYQFLAERYGDTKIQQWLEGYSGNLVPYWLNPKARRLFAGKDFLDLWEEFRQWLDPIFQKEISLLSLQPLQQGETFVNSAPFRQIEIASDTGLYRAGRYRDQRDTLERISAKGEREILDYIDAIASIDYHPELGLLLSRRIHYRNGQSYSDLFQWREGELTRLTEKRRYRSGRWLPDGSGIIARRIVNGISQLDKLDVNGHFLYNLWVGDNDNHVLGHFSLSPNGHDLVATMKRPELGWDLYQFNLHERRWLQLTNNRAVEADPEWSKDGKSILYSSDLLGISNLYRLQLSTHRHQQLTHLLGGAFAATQASTDAPIYYQNYLENGFNSSRLSSDIVPVSIHLESKPQPIKERSIDESDTYRVKTSPYSSIESILPTWWWPQFIANEEITSVGLFTSGGDLLGHHQYQLGYSRDLDYGFNQWLLSYLYRGDLLLTVEVSPTYFFASGANPLIVKGRQGSLLGLNLLTAAEDKWGLHAGVAHEALSVWRGPDKSLSGSVSESLLYGLISEYDSRERYLDSSGYASGQLFSVKLEYYPNSNSDYDGNRLQIQWQGYRDLKSLQILSLKSELLFAEETASAYILGGEGLSPALLSLGADQYSLRGYPSGFLVGRELWFNSLNYSMNLAMVERNWNIYPAGLGNIQLDLFVDHLYNNDADMRISNHFSVGLEINFEVVLGYQFLMPLKIGLAKGLNGTLAETRLYLSTGIGF